MAERKEKDVYSDDLSEMLNRNRRKKSGSDTGEHRSGNPKKNTSVRSSSGNKTVKPKRTEERPSYSPFGKKDIPDPKRDFLNTKKDTSDTKRDFSGIKSDNPDAKRNFLNIKRDTSDAKRDLPDAKRDIPETKADSESFETKAISFERGEEAPVYTAAPAAAVSADTATFSEVNEDIHDIDFDDFEDEPVKSKKTERRIREAERQLLRQSRAKRTVIQIILGLVVSGLVIFFGIRLGNFVYNAVIDYTGISNNEFQIVVELPENPSLDTVADVLKENGVISNEDFFKKYVEMKDDLEDFVGGEFVLSSSMNYSTIVSTLLASKNELITVEVTIIEGMTAYEVGQLLEENRVCRADDFMKFYRDRMNVYDFELRLSEDPHKFNQMEGYLFPDKYEFYVNNKLKNHPDEEIDTTKDAEVAAKKIYSNFNSKITKTMYKRMNEMGLTLNDLITLASIVQSEVGDIEDMKTVASVFLNRLRTGGEFSKLQSDVTVFYVQDYIEPYYKDHGLSTSLSVISNSYDTYECDGIPAGPICNPGMDAIGAVLDAYTTDYFYFCANEETGETYYGRTLEEHEANLVKAGLR